MTWRTCPSLRLTAQSWQRLFFCAVMTLREKLYNLKIFLNCCKGNHIFEYNKVHWFILNAQNVFSVCSFIQVSIFFRSTKFSLKVKDFFKCNGPRECVRAREQQQTATMCTLNTFYQHLWLNMRTHTLSISLLTAPAAIHRVKRSSDSFLWRKSVFVLIDEIFSRALCLSRLPLCLH